MPTTQITIDHISHRDSPHGSRRSSPTETDDSHGTGVQISPPNSDGGSSTGSDSSSGSSGSGGSRRSVSHGSYVHVPELIYPDEVDPEDSASRLPSHRHRRIAEVAGRRPATYRRDSRHRVIRDREELDHRHYFAHPAPESVDSAEEYVGPYGRPGPPAHRSSYTPYGVPPYATSSAEPFAQYPQVPSTQMTTQMMQAISPQSFPAYNPYSPGTQHAGYYPPTAGQGAMSYQNHFSSPAAVPYAAPHNQGYFPQYPVAQYALPPFYSQYQTRSPSPPSKKTATPPPAAPAPAPPVDNSENTMKLMKELFEKNQQIMIERDLAKEAELKKIEEAKKAAEERAAADKALAEAATAKARAEAAAEKEKADAATAKAMAEAEQRLLEAEEKAAKALAEANAHTEKLLKEAKEQADKETAEKVAAAKAAPPAEKKAPIKFKDAIGRKYQFPWHIVCKWQGMEDLINQAFEHVDGMAQHVFDGRYDLAGPSGDIILKDCWESTVEPDWTIIMHMWPLPEPPPDPVVDVVVVDESKTEKKPPKGKPKGKRPQSGLFSTWVNSSRGAPAKGKKK